MSKNEWGQNENISRCSNCLDRNGSRMKYNTSFPLNQIPDFLRC